MPRFYKSILAGLLLLSVAAPATAQVGVYSRVMFGTAFLDAVADCTTLTNIGVCVDTDNGSLWIKQSGVWTQITPGAPTTATYITQTANGTLSAEQALGSLATGLLKNATTTGVLSIGTVASDYFAPAGAMTPDGDNTRNIGSAGTKWADAFVTRLGIGNGTPAFTSPAKAFHLAHTFSGALGANEQRGAYYDVTYTPSASWSGGAQALYVKSQLTGTFANTSVIYGGLFQVNSTTSATSSVEVGIRGSIDRSGGNTSVAVPMSSFAGITNGTIGTLYSFELLQPTLGAGGAITNNYGLFIHDQTVAGASESWAIKYDAPTSNAFGVKADGTLHVGGADLPSCSNATTSKLLFNTTSKEFSCGTDQDGGAAVSNYQTVQDEGSDLAQQPKLNFIGAGVTCVDGASKTDCTITSSGAPTGATYITQTADGTLSAEQALSSLSTGVVKVTTTTGVLSTATEGTDYYKPGGTDVAFADGGTGLSSASDDTTLISNGSAWQAKSVPDCTDTGGNHLNYTASSNTLSCGTSSSGGGGSGGLVLLATYTASSSATLDITTRNEGSYTGAIFQSDFTRYRFTLNNLIPATNSVTFQSRVTTDGGSTWDSTGSYYWGANASCNTGASTLTGGAQTAVDFAGTIGNSFEGVSGELELPNPIQATLRHTYLYDLVIGQTGAFCRIAGGAIWTPTTAVNGIRFYYSSGNIASGVLRVYAYAQ